MSIRTSGTDFGEIWIILWNCFLYLKFEKYQLFCWGLNVFSSLPHPDLSCCLCGCQVTDWPLWMQVVARVSAGYRGSDGNSRVTTDRYNRQATLYALAASVGAGCSQGQCRVQRVRWEQQGYNRQATLYALAASVGVGCSQGQCRVQRVRWEQQGYRLAYCSALGGSLPHFKASFRPPAYSQNLPLSIKIWSTCVSGLDSDAAGLAIDQLPWPQQSILPIN